MSSKIDFTKCGHIFDEVALLYDRARPGYPEVILDYLTEQAAIPQGASVLDIGTGTGKSLQLFFDYGFSVVGIDPGENLLAVARSKFPNARLELAKFEDWDPKGCVFDLVISGQAFHWIPAEVSYRKAAELLSPMGQLALFWNMQPAMDYPLINAINEIYDQYIVGNEPMSPNQYQECYEAEIEKGRTEFDASGYFEPCRVARFPWSRFLTPSEYFDVQNTYPNHITMELDLKQKIFQKVETTINEHGGSVPQHYETVLYLGKKKNT